MAGRFSKMQKFSIRFSEGGSEIRQDLRAGNVPLNKHARAWAAGPGSGK
jgi:hypothetical protein